MECEAVRSHLAERLSGPLTDAENADLDPVADDDRLVPFAREYQHRRQSEPIGCSIE